MNKEYMYLNNKEMLVIDENGHAKKRAIEIDNMHDLLLLENNLEKINNMISDLEKILKQDEDSKLSRSAKIVLLILCLTILGVLGAFLSMVVHPVALIGTYLILIAMIGLIADSTRKNHFKQINGLKEKLSKAYEARENFEQRISNIRIQDIKLKKNDLFGVNKKTTNLTFPSEVIALETSTFLFEEANRQIMDSPIHGNNHNQERKRILKK